MGDFTYVPAVEGKVKSNQIQSTAIGAVFIGEDVATFVRRATALELQKAGTNITPDARRVIAGQIDKLIADDLGFSVDWSFATTYTVRDRESNNVLFQKQYSAKDRKTGKFGLAADYASTVNLLIVDVVEQFMCPLNLLSVLFLERRARSWDDHRPRQSRRSGMPTRSWRKAA